MTIYIIYKPVLYKHLRKYIHCVSMQICGKYVLVLEGSAVYQTNYTINSEVTAKPCSKSVHCASIQEDIKLFLNLTMEGVKVLIEKSIV